MAKIQLNKITHTNSIATAEYMAPEFITNQTFFPESDVFSFAILLWELFSEEKAFDQVNPVSIIYAITAGKRPEISKEKIKIPEIRDLIVDCWHENYKMRPNFTDIMNKLKIVLNIYKNKKKI